MNQQLSIQLVSEESMLEGTTGISLELEQETLPDDDINLRDIYNMWLQAREGYSARTAKPTDCSVKFTEETVTFSIGFFVWPFPVETPYALSASLDTETEIKEGYPTDRVISFGTISEGEHIERERVQSVTFPLSRAVNFGRVLVPPIRYEWETALYNSKGGVESAQPITIVGDALVIPHDFFGVARVSFVELGYRHEIEVTLKNVDEDGNNVEIDLPNITITALWHDEEGKAQTTQLQLEIPECVKAALKMCNGKPNMICQSCDAYQIIVYWNVCTGDVVEVRRVELEENGGSWCLPLV